jgi:biotin carboxyl carrier protein
VNDNVVYHSREDSVDCQLNVIELGPTASAPFPWEGLSDGPALTGSCPVLVRVINVLDGVSQDAQMPSSVGSLKFSAPIDCFISEVSVTSGQVQANDKLVTLKSPMLDSLSARLDIYARQLAIVQRPLNDGRVDEQIQTVTTKNTLLQNAVTSNQQLVADIEAEISTGQKKQDDLYAAQINLFSAQSAAADASLAADQTTKKKQDLLDKIAIAQDSLNVHSTYVAAMQAAMTIVAPIAGQFSLLVASGSFVKKGDTIGTLVP